MALATSNDASCSITDRLTLQACIEEAFGRNLLICRSLRVMSRFTSMEIFTRRHGLGFKLQGNSGLVGFALLALLIIQNISHV